MNGRLRFDLKPIQRGIKALAPQVKKSRRELAEEAARGFVKEVVAITPPASKGKRGNAAKKAGEGAIIADLARVMVAAARRKGVTLSDPAEIHKRVRDPHTGRIILTNAVKYVTNVESYGRRIQSAINIQGKKMLRRAEFLLTRALRQAGWM